MCVVDGCGCVLVRQFRPTTTPTSFYYLWTAKNAESTKEQKKAINGSVFLAEVRQTEGMRVNSFEAINIWGENDLNETAVANINWPNDSINGHVALISPPFASFESVRSRSSSLPISNIFCCRKKKERERERESDIEMKMEAC